MPARPALSIVSYTKTQANVCLVAHTIGSSDDDDADTDDCCADDAGVSASIDYGTNDGRTSTLLSDTSGARAHSKSHACAEVHADTYVFSHTSADINARTAFRCSCLTDCAISSSLINVFAWAFHIRSENIERRCCQRIGGFCPA
mmetsp:Transcript_90835/g.228471  ORF Transcript_90835/g.228471 Transcript_90835/m.228471 type:complete len:145 (+) Transcript_90835:1360-1794(+)